MQTIATTFWSDLTPEVQKLIKENLDKVKAIPVASACTGSNVALHAMTTMCEVIAGCKGDFVRDVFACESVSNEFDELIMS